jgi:hypothetical protein
MSLAVAFPNNSSVPPLDTLTPLTVPPETISVPPALIVAETSEPPK